MRSDDIDRPVAAAIGRGEVACGYKSGAAGGQRRAGTADRADWQRMRRGTKIMAGSRMFDECMHVCTLQRG